MSMQLYIIIPQRLVFISILISAALFHDSTHAELQGERQTTEQATKIAYLTSWSLPHNAVSLLSESNADAYILSFARWDKSGRISSSNGLLDLPKASPKHIPQSYLTWTQLAHEFPHKKMIISFGGQEFEDIWDSMGTDVSIEKLAQSITQLLNTKFPVYTRTSMIGKTLPNKAVNNAPKYSADEIQTSCNQCVYHLLGYTTLSGIDFDFEHSARLTEKQNELLTNLVKLIRKKVGKEKLIALTTYHVGADPLNCANPKITADCSFIRHDRSKHHGEVRPLLASTLGLFDFYNIMTYDAGREFDYKTAMTNYNSIIKQASKLRLGVSINQQWGPYGGFVMPHHENVSRVKWAKEQGFGGYFLWALGASTELRDLHSQIALFNELSVASKK